MTRQPAGAPGRARGARQVALAQVALALAALVTLAMAGAAAAQTAQTTKIRVGWASRTVSVQTAPFAIATKLGWFREEGLEVELVPLAGSVDGVKNVATREVPFALASPEPLAVAWTQGLRAKTFYTAYQGNIFLVTVPADSPIRTIADLRGKTIGVPSMGSNGVIVARALAAAHGLNPDKDITIVPVGEAAQSAAMLRSRQVDALSQGDTQHAIVENAGGIRLRALDNSAIARFPSDGFIALDETLKTRSREAIGLARGYAKGTVFTIANPEAAVRIFYEVYPHGRPTGKDELTAIRDNTRVLAARIQNWRLERSGAIRWGENSEANYAAYLDFLQRWGVLKERVGPGDLVTYSLIDEINRFDAGRIAAEARAFTPSR